MIPSPTPVILDFDNAVGDMAGAIRLPLQHWQQTIRFGCRRGEFDALGRKLADILPQRFGCVFTGSGDFHHLTQLLLRRLSPQLPIQLVICDNHPDNMRYPFGIHCGSWVYWASRLPQVKKIHVLGICSSDIAATHAWENHLSPLYQGKLHYWNINVNTRWLGWFGAGRCGHTFANADDLLDGFLAQLDPLPVYLSIDKDVLSTDVVNTNWDQGVCREDHLHRLITALRPQLIGADITGDVSACRYNSRFKRWLSAGDGQKTPSVEEAAVWQQRQNALNRRLLVSINAGWRPAPR